MSQRTVSPHEMCDVLVKGIDRTNKSDRAISRETGTNYETVRNIRKRRHAPTAAVFFEFLLRYAEVRDVVDEYLDLKSQKQQTRVRSPHVVQARSKSAVSDPSYSGLVRTQEATAV